MVKKVIQVDINLKVMKVNYKSVPENEAISSKKKNIDEIIKENLELMYSIQKNRNNFCQLVGGC